MDTVGGHTALRGGQPPPEGSTLPSSMVAAASENNNAAPPVFAAADNAAAVKLEPASLRVMEVTGAGNLKDHEGIKGGECSKPPELLPQAQIPPPSQHPHPPLPPLQHHPHQHHHHQQAPMPLPVPVPVPVQVPVPQPPAKDSTVLRKGKWTLEEEEYTARIIHYFNVGLLTLPEGQTLRSYISKKLHCDPMRVTKKFTGACCIGKRVFNVGNRRQLTHADVQAAMKDLEKLEARFWATLEQNEDGYRSSDLMKRSGLGDAAFLSSYMGGYHAYYPSSLTPLPPELDPLKNPALYKTLTSGVPLSSAFLDFKSASASAVAAGSRGPLPAYAQQAAFMGPSGPTYIPYPTAGKTDSHHHLHHQAMMGGDGSGDATRGGDNKVDAHMALQHLLPSQHHQRGTMIPLPAFAQAMNLHAARGGGQGKPVEMTEDFQAMMGTSAYSNSNNMTAMAQHHHQHPSHHQQQAAMAGLPSTSTSGNNNNNLPGFEDAINGTQLAALSASFGTGAPAFGALLSDLYNSYSSLQWPMTPTKNSFGANSLLNLDSLANDPVFAFGNDSRQNSLLLAELADAGLMDVSDTRAGGSTSKRPRTSSSGEDVAFPANLGLLKNELLTSSFNMLLAPLDFGGSFCATEQPTAKRPKPGASSSATSATTATTTTTLAPSATTTSGLP